MEGYIEIKIENNLPIPISEAPNNYSGKFVVRLPKSLHQRFTLPLLTDTLFFIPKICVLRGKI